MQLTHALIAAGALGALAHPSGHNHRHAHAKRQAVAVYETIEEFVTVYVTEDWPPPTLTTTTTTSSTPNNLPNITTPAIPNPANYSSPTSTSSSSSRNPERTPEPAHNNPAPTPSNPAPAPAPAPNNPAPAPNNPAPAPAPAPVPSNPAPVPAPAPVPKNSGSPGQRVPFCSGNSKRATLAQIAQQGNTGSTYGCNIMTVAPDIANLYDYTTTFQNVAKKEYQVICANKFGRNGGVNGFFEGSESVEFQLAPGASQTVAFEADSLGACFMAEGKVPTDKNKLYLGTWFEFSFGVSANNGWSGADCSSITSANSGATIFGCQACNMDSSSDQQCSTILPGGKGHNAFNTVESAKADGLGLNIPSSTRGVKLRVSVGYGSA